MPTQKKLLLTCLLALGVSPATCFALLCKEDRTEQVISKQDLGTAIAVAADAPDGTIIWESEPRSINVRCADDNNSGREYIYFHMNPGKVNIGQGLRIGIRYKSNAITQSSGAVSTGYDSWTGCYGGGCTGWDRARFTLNFSVFVEKYGATPVSGQATTSKEYRVFQLDGKGGLNMTPDSNLNYVISGLDKIRFVPCSPELFVSPSVVNFSRIRTDEAQIGKVAGSGSFSLGLKKDCDTPYTVSARFSASAGGGKIVDNLLVPPKNSSVGISLYRQETNEKVPFSTWFPLAVLTGKEYSTNEFRADLVWRANPVLGPFDASLVIDLFYK
ncbi:hypothetical protein [Pseudomonas alkylphenolica]|uniref:hypothetical protein n=1 Tax=Pseudomonas alkylphenolica TaxID=237609 RepID=UPI00315D2115